MFLKNKGFMYYEIIISLTILLIISSSLLSVVSNISIRLENQRLTYKMKQNLTLNIILLENDKELVLDSSYNLTLDENQLCIIWRDLYGKKQSICQKVRV